jgi:hypothetical protein
MSRPGEIVSVDGIPARVERIYPSWSAVEFDNDSPIHAGDWIKRQTCCTASEYAGRWFLLAWEPDNPGGGVFRRSAPARVALGLSLT